MKTIILLLCLIIFAPFAAYAQKYKHKSEAEIAQMTPAQHVDEYINEVMYHPYGALDDDELSKVIDKYIRRDGLKALPRVIEVLNEYDPTRSSGRSGKKASRAEHARWILYTLDNHIIRLRASEEGRNAIDALGRVIEQMRTAGYAVKKDGFDKNNSQLIIAVGDYNGAKGVNSKDDDIQDTLRFIYKITLSDAEMLEFSNYLTAHYPEYPTWSEGKLTTDNTELSPAGFPVRNIILTTPERFHEAYLEFKKTK